MRNPVIQTFNLSKSYDGKIVLDRIDFTLRQGEIYGLLGRNGTGKTTFIKAILGLTAMDSGEVNILSEKLLGEFSKDLLSQIGVVLDSASFYPNLTGPENLSIFARLRGSSLKQVEQALQVVGLDGENKKLFKQYSLGMKQRLAIANAIMHQPKILILDEPTNGLDPIGILEMRRYLKELSTNHGISILISSHIISELEKLVDRVGILHDSHLMAEKTMKELIDGADKRKIHLIVSDAPQAKEVLCRINLQEQISILSDIELELQGESPTFDIAVVSNSLKDNGIVLKEYSYKNNESLEDYFKRVTGGEGIA